MSTNPTDWFQHFYHPNSTAATPPSSTGVLSDSTVVSTTISNDNTPPTTNNFISFSELGLAVSVPGPSATASTTHQPNPAQGGRVLKPARRRQRASKKTPTTLLNTDAANFRSMVQRYTGGPSAYAPPPQGLSIGGSSGQYGQPHQGQFGNFNQHGTRPFVPAVDNLPQQILQQYGAGFSNGESSSSRDVNRRGMGMTTEEEIGFFSLNHHLGPAGGSADHSSSLGGGGSAGGGGGGGGGENERRGFMF